MCVEELVTNIWSSPHLNLRDFPLSNRRLWLVKVRIEREKRMLRGISRSYPSPSWKLRSIRRFSTPVSISDDVTTGGFINSLAGNNPTLLGMKSLHKHFWMKPCVSASGLRWRTDILNHFIVGPVADATTKPILDSIIELTNDSVCGLVLFTVLLRSLGQLSVYKSMKLEIEELRRRENFLDKKWDI